MDDDAPPLHRGQHYNSVLIGLGFENVVMGMLDG